MNITASLLILIAVVLSVLVFVSLIGWWRGVDNVLFPGLGIIAAMPAVIVSLLVLNVIFVIAAAAVKPKTEIPRSKTDEQSFQYPNDIFSGCGNGTLTLSLAKNPESYDRKTDRGLKVCINENDLEALRKIDEQNHKMFREFASAFPILGKIDDVYQDYVFNREEIEKLRVECLKLQNKHPDAAADLALRKLTYACDEALKDDFYLMFSGD